MVKSCEGCVCCWPTQVQITYWSRLTQEHVNLLKLKVKDDETSALLFVWWMKTLYTLVHSTLSVAPKWPNQYSYWTSALDSNSHRNDCSACSQSSSFMSNIPEFPAIYNSSAAQIVWQFLADPWGDVAPSWWPWAVSMCGIHPLQRAKYWPECERLFINFNTFNSYVLFFNCLSCLEILHIIRHCWDLFLIETESFVTIKGKCQCYYSKDDLSSVTGVTEVQLFV